MAIPAVDTIVHVNNDTQEIIKIPKRAEYYQGQTPQAFKLGTLKKLTIFIHKVASKVLVIVLLC